jgi:hypothetical protein
VDRAGLANVVAGSFPYLSDRTWQFVARNLSHRNSVALGTLQLVRKKLRPSLRSLASDMLSCEPTE